MQLKDDIQEWKHDTDGLKTVNVNYCVSDEAIIGVKTA